MPAPIALWSAVLVAAIQGTSSTIPARLEHAEAERSGGSLDSAAALLTGLLHEAESSRDRRLFVEVSTRLAAVRAQTDRPDLALGLLARAERAGARGEPALLARVVCARAPVLAMAGLARGEAEVLRGLRLAQRAGDHALTADCWQALGILRYYTVDDPARSGAPFDSAAELRRRHRDFKGLAETLVWSGADRLSYWDNGGAKARLDEAMATIRAARLTALEGRVHHLLGTVAWRTGDFPTAASELERGARMLEQSGDRLELMRLRRIQGHVAYGLGRVAEAEREFGEGLAEAERLGDVLAVGQVRFALAWVPAARGDWGSARRQLRSAIAYLRAHGAGAWADGFRYADGVMALHLGHLDEAERIFRRYLNTTNQTEYVGRYQGRTRLAQIHLRRGRPDLAIAELESAADQIDSLRATLDDHGLRTLAFQTSGGKLEEPDYGFATAIAALVRSGHVAPAFDLSERRRARELSDRLLRTGFGADSAQTMPRTPVKALVPDSPVPAAVTDDSTAIVEYLTGRRGQATTAFVLSKAGLEAYVLAPIDSVAPELDRFLGLLRHGGDVRLSGAQLRRALLDPLLAALPATVRRLVVVPDDVLHHLPFDALPLVDDRPLVWRYAVSFAPSVAVAGRLRTRPRAERPARVLAMGDASFGVAAADESGGASYGLAFAEAGGLTRLAASGAEARMVARYGDRSVVRTGAEATEAFVKRGPVDSFGVVHFAAHALVNEWTAAKTALALAPGEGEDGFLAPAEILGLRLAADMVVLSGCRTAGGSIVGGEGVQGLTGPLLAAGARSVVATLWPIDDRGTLRFMREFYLGVARGLPLTEALRAAKLEAIGRGAGPAEWAAFTMVGDPFVRLRLTAPRLHGAWLAAGGVLLVLAIYGFRIRSSRSSESTWAPPARHALTHHR